MDNGFDETVAVFCAGDVVGGPTRSSAPGREADSPGGGPEHRDVVVPVPEGKTISGSEADQPKRPLKRGELTRPALHDVHREPGVLDEDGLPSKGRSNPALGDAFFDRHLGLPPPVREESAHRQAGVDEAAVSRECDTSVRETFHDLVSVLDVVQDSPVLGDDRTRKAEKSMERQRKRQNVSRGQHYRDSRLGHSPDDLHRLDVEPSFLVREGSVNVGHDRPDRTAGMSLWGRQPSLPRCSRKGSWNVAGR